MRIVQLVTGALLASSLLAPLVVLADARDRGADPSAPRDGAELLKRIAAGPAVVLARVVRLETKAALELVETLRGENLPPVIRLAYRGNNLLRQPGSAPFAPIESETAVFVLTPWVDSRGRQPKLDLYMPAGFAGARIPIPAEGGEALLQAVREIVAYEDGLGGSQAAQVLAWVEGRNPWLIDAGLQVAGELVLADADWVPALLERTRDANPARRMRALRALSGAMQRGRISDRGRGMEIDERAEASRQAIIRLARTDPEFEVRAEAVRALASVGIPGAREILASIARDDPSQDVRYEAAAALVTGVRELPPR